LLELGDDAISHFLCRRKDGASKFGDLVPAEGHRVESASGEEPINLTDGISDNSQDMGIKG
jgi:hypothetical protein